jgi:hypothetical protein
MLSLEDIIYLHKQKISLLISNLYKEVGVLQTYATLYIISTPTAILQRSAGAISRQLCCM